MQPGLDEFEPRGKQAGVSQEGLIPHLIVAHPGMTGK